MTDALPALTFHEVDAERWPDLVRFFEARGGPQACWCMLWRRLPSRARGDSAAKRAALGEYVSTGTPIGILGYADDEPVAWCSIAPRETYRPLGGPDDVEAERPGEVWSLVCFFVPRRLRGRGITRQLIAAAVEHAAARGARVVEAYPVNADSPSYGFGGRVGTFVAAGFEEIGRAGTRRHVMRRRITPG